MGYQFGICEWSLPVSGPLAIRLAGEAGFTGIQLGEAGRPGLWASADPPPGPGGDPGGGGGERRLSALPEPWGAAFRRDPQ